MAAMTIAAVVVYCLGNYCCQNTHQLGGYCCLSGGTTSALSSKAILLLRRRLVALLNYYEVQTTF